MKWFHDLPIARKLAVGFTLTTLMTVVLGAFALVRLSEANAKLTSMATNDIPSVQYLGEVRSQLGEFRTYELAQISMLDQPEKVADYNKRMNDTAAVVREQLAAYAKLPAGDKERTLYQAVQADVDGYFAANTKLREAATAGDGEAARQISDEQSRPLRRKAFEDLKALGTLLGTQMQGKIEDANATHRNSMLAIIAAIVLLVVVATTLAVVISRAVVGPLGKAVHAIQAVARGDLSVTTQATGKDEAGRMLAALATSRPLICWASCRKKPSLPSARMRPDRSPAAAWAITRATSASTSASGVRSRHSTTWPTLSPSWLRMVDTTWANCASPNCMARRATPFALRLFSRLASISPRCSSTVSGRPTSEVPASKSGRCLRSSSWYWDRLCSSARLA